MEAFAKSADCSENEAKIALNKAIESYHRWKLVNAKYRAKILRLWASIVRENSENITELLTMELGKFAANPLEKLHKERL